MVRERYRRRLHERLSSLAGASLGPVQAQYEAISALRQAVGFDRWCWPRMDPRSWLATNGVAEFDLWAELPRLAALEQHGDLTSKPRLALSPRASITLSAATGGDLPRSRRWRECLEPYGIGDELMTLCRDHHGCWGSVELMRDADDPPFDEEQVELLHELSPMLGTLLRRSLLHDAPVAEHSQRAPLPPATLILDDGFRPVSWTAAFRDWQDELQVSVGAEMLPPAVYEIAARIRAPADAVPPLPGAVRMRATNGAWVVIEGAPLEGAERGQVAITIRAASADDVFDLLCKTCDLTSRERQLTALVIDGMATKQLAEALFISPYTVQDHLKSIFAKTGVRTRRELVSRLSTGSARA